MRKLFLTALFTALVVSSTAASSAVTRTKIGKLRISPKNGVGVSIVKFGRADGGTFDGCTLDPTYVTTARPVSFAQPLDSVDTLAMLLAAKQSDFEVLVGYFVEPSGRCVARSLEIQ